MFIIILYSILNTLLLPLYLVLLATRWFKGKENITSILSRTGVRFGNRPRGKLIWINAASVGESIIAKNLIETLQKENPSYNFLITTGTLSSAKMFKRWQLEKTWHEFTPLDNLITLRLFFRYWQPDIGIFIESDLWPALMLVGAQNCQLLLLNGRLSDKSFARWQKFSKIFKILTDQFKFIAVQSEIDLKKYQALGQFKAQNLQNLKFANKPLAVDQQKFELLSSILTNKQVFVAASTAPEDEEVLLPVIKDVIDQVPEFFPVIIPRHPERLPEIEGYCQRFGLTYSVQSRDKTPNLNKNIFIVDAFGAVGLFCKLAKIVFVGGSFKRGGHNLLEPASFGKLVIVGSDMSNFQDITTEMLKKNACIQIHNGDEFKEKLLFFLDKSNSLVAATYEQNAETYVESKAEVMNNYLNHLKKFLP